MTIQQQCTTADHEAIKTDDLAWSQLDYIGTMVIEACEDEPEERLEMRNCGCHSTLCRTVKS